MPALDRDDAAQLRDSVRRFLHEQYGFEWRRARLGDERVDEAIWTRYADNGWLALGLPERCGGFGAFADLGCLLEPIGECLVLEPVLAHLVAAGLIACLGTPGQQDEELAPMIAGERRLVLAIHEPHAHFDPFDWRTVARATGEGFVLDGVKSTVVGGAAAHGFLVAARLDDPAGPAVVLRVPAAADGVEVTARRLFDGRRAADVAFTGVVLPGAARLGSCGADARAALALMLDVQAAALCAEALGAMRVAFDLTLDHLKQRVQFGRPLSHNQALQHRMVDLLVLRRESEALAAHALRSLDGPDARRRARAVSSAGMHVGATAVKVGQECVQLHGAIGTTDELAASHYFKRLAAIDLEGGSGRFHARRLQSLLREDLLRETA